MGSILIDNRQIHFTDIKRGNWPDMEPYMVRSLQFCKAWLNGKTVFEQQTSGSTGTPKTISVSRYQMQESAKATGAFFGIKDHAKLLCCLNTEMIAGKMMLVRAMEWNGTLHLVKPSSDPLSSFLPDISFDFVAMVPLQLQHSLVSPESKIILLKIKNLIIGGAPLPEGIQREAANLPGNVYQTFGMTETVSHIALAAIQDNGPLVYQALPGVSIGISQNGNLCIVTKMAIQNPLNTNDIIEMAGEDRFIWKGRSDYIINSGGIKIQPEELEMRFAEPIHEVFPDRRFFMAGVPDKDLGEKLVLVIEAQRDIALEKKLLIMLSKYVDKYRLPKRIIFHENFKLTASDKIDRIETLKIADR